MQQKLFNWYQKYGRHDLPWRQTSNSYHIYLSEIMLQQTQVKTVLERFYFPFLERFPTLESVAKAQLDDVLKMWEGLGYYTRARNLHTSALTCKGVLPQRIEELQALKGIGKSTAHAIGVFAYRQILPILDANVKRILCRFFGLLTKDEKVLWEKAWEFLNTSHPYEHNQAMMDLGSLICTAKKPLCEKCPLQDKCLGKENPQLYPKAIQKMKVPLKKRFALVVEKEGKFGLFQRKEKLLHGLWGFVQVDEILPNNVKLGSVQQVYSHFKLELEVVTCKDCDVVEKWVTFEEMKLLALSNIDKKIANLLKNS